MFPAAIMPRILFAMNPLSGRKEDPTSLRLMENMGHMCHGIDETAGGRDGGVA